MRPDQYRVNVAVSLAIILSIRTSVLFEVHLILLVVQIKGLELIFTEVKMVATPGLEPGTPSL